MAATKEKLRRLVAKLEVDLGTEIMSYLNDDDIIEIMLNTDGYVWTEGFESGMVRRFQMDAIKATMIIGTIADHSETVVNYDNPILSGILPIGKCRFQGLVPPVVEKPSFCIRKPAVRVFSLQDYVDNEIMTPAIAMRIRDAVMNRENIIVAGGTGSGKTTLSNAVIGELVTLAPHHRLVIIEDTPEIQCLQKNYTSLRTSDNVTMNDLLRNTMRLRPDRIIVGEVRNAEALTLLDSWNTGHPGGIATIHANSAALALDRFETCIMQAMSKPNRKLIGEAVNLIIYIEKLNSSQRVIKEIVEVKGYRDGDYVLNTIFKFTNETNLEELTHAKTEK